MKSDQSMLEQFLNSLEGEVVAIIPNVNPKFTPGEWAPTWASFWLWKKWVKLKEYQYLSTFLFCKAAQSIFSQRDFETESFLFFSIHSRESFVIALWNGYG